MGHVRSYTIGDAYSRFRRARGDAILFSLGFDAFGLPSEVGALNNKEAPWAWVERCANAMRAQFDSLGYSFDWKRSFITCDEQIYQWTQWLFLTLLENGLIYRDVAQVEWCENCQTTLAAAQVLDGDCWRCQQRVTFRTLPQWFLRLTDYIDENDRRLGELTRWNRVAVGSQVRAVGGVRGVELRTISSDGDALTVFTPHRGLVGAATMILVSPQHPHSRRWMDDPSPGATVEDLARMSWRRVEHQVDTALVMDTGQVAKIDGTDIELPILISPTVDVRCGVSAIFGIPSKEPIDAQIASMLDLPERDEPIIEIPAELMKDAVRHRGRDFSISRRRVWGTPIPLVKCDLCGTQPVPIDSLPVRLPDIGPVQIGGSLADYPDFYRCSCPKCGGDAHRETETLDCHFDGMWFWMVSCVPPRDRKETLFAHSEVSRWLPATNVVWGADGGDMILDIRTLTKALRDLGHITHMQGEPFRGMLMHEMVRIDGHKMSKHIGNTVEPEALVDEFGADAIRLAVLFAAAPASTFSWRRDLPVYLRKVLERIWLIGQMYLSVEPKQERAGDAPPDPRRNRLAVWCKAGHRRITEDYEELALHKVVRNVILLLERIEQFERMAMDRPTGVDVHDELAICDALLLLLRMLAPAAPHIAEELWSRSGQRGMIAELRWPEAISRCGEMTFASVSDPSSSMFRPAP